MAKVFTFKGKTIEDLQKLSLEEFAKLIKSKQRRNLMRGFSDKQKKLLDKMRKSNKPPKTHCRDMVIIPEMVGKTIQIHTGKEWLRLDLKTEMLGHKLGEFALTRHKVSHSAPGVGATKSSKNLPMK